MKKPSLPIYAFTLLAFLVIGTSACVNAQSNDPEAAVRSAIDSLFDAMRAGDGDAVSNAFHESARMSSIGEREGEPRMRSSSPADFATSVGTPHDDIWDERIWDVTIHVDGNMASAWVPYAFYLGDSFSHCGTNTMTLFNSVDGWKITSLTDTRRQNDCNIPAEVSGQ